MQKGESGTGGGSSRSAGEGEAERHRPRKKQIECNQLAQMDSSIPDEVKLTAAGVDSGVFDA